MLSCLCCYTCRRDAGTGGRRRGQLDTNPVEQCQRTVCYQRHWQRTGLYGIYPQGRATMNAIFDFSSLPTIDTERLRLRQISHEDADAMMAIYSGTEMMRFL